MIEVGTLQDLVASEDVSAYTFHPFEDIWWVISSSNEIEVPALCTFKKGRCTIIEYFHGRAGRENAFAEMLNRQNAALIEGCYR